MLFRLVTDIANTVFVKDEWFKYDSMSEKIWCRRTNFV